MRARHLLMILGTKKQRFHQWRKWQSKEGDIYAAVKAMWIDTGFVRQVRQWLLVALRIGWRHSTQCEKLLRH
jgi:hypothetical protein